MPAPIDTDLLTVSQLRAANRQLEHELAEARQAAREAQDEAARARKAAEDGWRFARLAFRTGRRPTT